MDLCETIKLIPKAELERVFTESDTASAEMDFTFMCFEDVYMKVKGHCNKDTIIIDLGCAYAPQSYWFTDCKKYIGVDLPFGNNIRFETPNSEFYIMSGQRFIDKILPTLNLDFDNVIAVCSYVPDVGLQKKVRDTFKYNYVQYCTEIISDKLPERGEEE